MTSPDATVLAAFEAACVLAAEFPAGVVVPRLIDADAFLDPSWLPHRAPRHSVEVIVGLLGVVVVGTGRDGGVSYRALVRLSDHAYLRPYVECGLLAAAMRLSPGLPGIYEP